ncbi:MAG: aspartate--tRNA(Asn) ligase [Firmicutes bacterium]|nr:aspartate--tRNA(Asn) ligase [Bacillota bacterium]
MKITQIKNIKIGEVNKVSGWIENIRDKKSMAFVVLRDNTGKLQITINKEETPELVEVVSSLTLHGVATFTGKVVASEFVKMGGMEMLPTAIVVESRAEALPIQDDAEFGLKLDYRWLPMRDERDQLMFKVQTTFQHSIREFLVKSEFVEIHSPKILGAPSESGSEVFEVKYFEGKAYLAQSPQFYKQMAMAGGLGKVFEFGPVFRAEKSFTSQHSTEFTGFDIEMSYISDPKEIKVFESKLLVKVLTDVKKKHGEDIKRVFGADVVVPKLPFPVMSLKEIYKEIRARYGFKFENEANMTKKQIQTAEGDLTKAAEILCGKLSIDKFGHEFLFATGYAKENRAFYHMRDNKEVPKGFDLIWKGVEINTGAIREHRYDVLVKQANERGLKKDVEFYLEFFKYGCPPHGGFGMGLDRFTALLLNIPTIKEAMFLVRTPSRLSP